MKKLLTIIGSFTLAPIITLAQCRIDYTQYIEVINETFDNYGGSVTNLLNNGPWRATYPNNPLAGKGVEYYNPSQLQLIPDGSGGHRLRLNATKLSPPYINVTRGSHNVDLTYVSGILTLKDDIRWDPITTSCINDPNTRGFAYGMFEIRCIMPTNQNVWNTWPAFWIASIAAEIDIIDNLSADHKDYLHTETIDWMKQPWWPSNPDWNQVTHCPTCPEFEICKDYNLGDIISTNWASFQANKNTQGGCCGMQSYSNLPMLTQDFHTYTMVWTPNEVTFFFDGREIHTVPSSSLSLGDCPANVIADLGVFSGANTLPDGTNLSWDIDYIKVYKPKGPLGNGTNLTHADYVTTSYKSNHEFINYSPLNNINNFINVSGVVKAKAYPRSIAINPQDPAKIFYTGDNGRLYYLEDPQLSQNWNTLFQVPFSNNSNSLIDGDLVFDTNTGKLIYRGQDGRIQYYLYTTNGWTQDYIDNNWSTSQFLVSNSKGCISVSQNSSTIFYKGTDSKIHYFAGGLGNSHAWIGHNYIANSTHNHYVGNDILLEEVSSYTHVIYKGLDNRLQIFWVDINQNPPQYVHAYIDNSGISTWAVSPKPGSVTLGDQGVIYYIGINNEIHGYKYTGTGSNHWAHVNITHTYSSNEYARNGITYDPNSKSIIYLGMDGRMQYFKENLATNSWDHGYIDEYWNSNEYLTFNSQNTLDYPSLIYEQTTNRIYYIGDFSYNGSPNNSYPAKDNERHIRYFTHEPCSYVAPCTNSNKFLNKPMRNPNIVDTTRRYTNAYAAGLLANNENSELPILNKNSSDNKKNTYGNIIAFPNPSHTGVFNINPVFENAQFQILDMKGKSVQVTLDKTILDISHLPNGVYFLLVINEAAVYKQKLVISR